MKLKNLLFMIACTLLVSACGVSDREEKNNKTAKGDVYYGGVFNANEIEDFKSLYPLNTTEEVGARIVSQIYEGLVKLNQKDLSVIPAIAEKWDVNENATEFTFHIRKGVYFHDDACFSGEKGREVTANDFKYCFDKLCSPDPQNQSAWAFKDKVKGASEFFKSDRADKSTLAKGVSGVTVIDEYTLKIELIHPFAGFLYLLSQPACAVYPHEAYDKYGIDMRVKCVGTGPFKVKEIKEGEATILLRNPNYWAYDEFGNQLPYLDAIKITFVKEKKAELLEFKKGNLDMVFRLPLEMIGDVVGELEQAKAGGNPAFEMQIMPAASIIYYGFQHQSELFKNKYLRLAFNYAIDREALVNFTLQGEGTPARYGIVPPCFKDYNHKSIKGFTFDPDLARKYIAMAGYPNGKGFPDLTLDINSGGSRNTQIAEVLQKMLRENLNIKIKINIVPFAQHIENFETGKSLFWKAGWNADYPDPENFLNVLYSKHIPANLHEKSYINSVRYANNSLDSLFVLAQKEINLKKRNEYLIQADQIQINDAAIMPLYYQENTRLLQLKVKGFNQNAMEYRDFSTIYFDKSTSQK